ncbi:MAG: class I SAM-dependent methyltransferase [Candidatus Omnitrophica bacterium]|nr:class I SAM-dependent methyltransferase [Candidatus Omnitrophota bacterium]
MKLAPTMQKLRGGYYTPKPIARFLCEWAIRSPDTKVLEPSCGDGNVLLEAANVLVGRKRHKAEVGDLLVGIELDDKEAASCLRRLHEQGINSQRTVVVGDFFECCREMETAGIKFDAVVGNPPFIRYQHFSEKQREVAIEIMHASGLKPNRLMNSWVPFLVGATRLLSDRGRLAMVIPAELLQVNYAAEVRRLLSESYSRITLVTFRQLVFEGIQQEVVLLLGERNGSEKIGIRTIELSGIEDLAAYDHSDFSSEGLRPIDHSTEKWTQYFLTTEEVLLLRRLRKEPRIRRVADLAEVDVGIVTGLNEFFVVNNEKLQELALREYGVPIVSRSMQLGGVVYSKADWKANAEDNHQSFLLNLPDVPLERLPAAARKYIAEGESKGFHEGYKCRIRGRWYIVPSIWAPTAFMLRQVHRYPKVILNRTDATCTDTIHRVRFCNGTSREIFATAFLNSMTFAFSEVMGRSYGGGVLELEPKEAEGLPIPIDGAGRLDIKQINELVLAGNIEAVLDLTDSVLLERGLGLPMKETRMLRGIWRKLRDRRNARR